MVYLKLKFKGANLYDVKGKNANNSFDVISGKSEKIGLTFVEPITSYQISNIIHVLFNERPVSTIRTSLYKPNERLVKIANDSYLKINNHKRINKKSGEEYFIREVIQTDKAKFNSTSPVPTSNWEYIRRYFGDSELFDEFKNKLNDILNCDISKKPITKIKNMLVGVDVSELHLWLKDNGKTAVYDYIIKNTASLNAPDISSKTKNVLDSSNLNVVSGLSTKINLNGEIVIPLNDVDYNYIKDESRGIAKLLDGGLVYIDSIKQTFNDEGFIKVSNISLEKRK